MSTAWLHLLLRMSPGILWKLQVVLVSRKERTTYQSYVCTTFPVDEVELILAILI